MPNWCSNDVVFIAKTDEVFHDILEYVESDHEPLSLMQIVEPVGDTIEAAVAVWGTKWELSEVRCNIYREQLTACFSFETAWAPPIEAMQLLSSVFPDVYISVAFDEPGMDFGGYAIYLAGAVYTEAAGNSFATTWAQRAEFALEAQALWTEEDMQVGEVQ